MSKRVVLNTLYCDKSSERGDDEIYIKVRTDSKTTRFPRVVKGCHENYVEMSEDDEDLNDLSICKEFESANGKVTVEVWEDDTTDSDFIGSVTVDHFSQKAGTYTAKFTGDDGIYRLLYTIEERGADRSCRSGGSRLGGFCTRGYHDAGSLSVSRKCKKSCDKNGALNIGIKNCTLGKSCPAATVFLACVAACELF